MYVSVPFLTTTHLDLNNIVAYDIFIKSHDDPSVLYVGYCGDCDGVNKPPVEWQTDFSVCIGASFCCFDNHVETMTNSLSKMKHPCANTFLKRAVVNLLLVNLNWLLLK